MSYKINGVETKQSAAIGTQAASYAIPVSQQNIEGGQLTIEIVYEDIHGNKYISKSSAKLDLMAPLASPTGMQWTVNTEKNERL